MRPLRSILLMFVIAFPAAAQERAAEWRDDIRALASQLEQVHPRFKACGLTPDLRRGFDDLAARAGALRDEEITIGIQRLLAQAGDGHTLLWPFGMKRGQLMRIPVGLWQFDDGLYVIRSARPEIVGKRVVKIGSLGAAEVMERLEPYISHDNVNQLRWAAPLYATFTDLLVATGAVPERGRAALTLEGGGEVVFEAVPVDPDDLETKLVAPPGVAPPMVFAHRHEKFWSTRLPGGALYVQVNAIDDAKEQTLAAFGTDLRNQLAGTRKLVLDLRLNNGGEASKANELLKTLIAFDVSGGRIAVLIGRMTFSAAQTLATRLDEWTAAQFVGEPTGSRPNHYGNERPFKLPHSGLRGTIASGLNQPVTARDTRTAIEPDVAVPLLAADYFRGADPALDAAVQLLSK